MKIVIPGGSGQVGQVLARTFLRDGHDVVILTREPAESLAGRTAFWDGRTLGNWTTELEAADVRIGTRPRAISAGAGD